MASLSRLLILPVVLLCGACQDPPGSDPGPAPSAARTESVPPDVLQVPPDRVSRIQLSIPHGGGRTAATLEKSPEGWMIVEPIRYRADPNAVDSMLAVTGEIEVVKVLGDEPSLVARHGVDRSRGIDVEVWQGGRVASRFTVGLPSGERTYLRREGDPAVLAVSGRCRAPFDKTLDQLRDPRVTDLDVTKVESVRYENESGRIDLVAEPDAPGKFRIEGPSIPDFDHERASKNVAVIARLFAKSFVDRPLDRGATGLFAPEAPHATLTIHTDAGKRSVQVWVGAPAAGGLMHVRTSESDQVYLVSAHLRSSLVPKPSHFERSDEKPRPHTHAHGSSHPHVHDHDAPPPTKVPAAMLEDLRALAKDQASR